MESTTAIVVMGVSGSGKTTVAVELARRLGWPFAEGDDFHPAANVAKMRAGTPLDDDDRWPWLRTVGAWMAAESQAGRSCVVTCSALKRSYRELLLAEAPAVWFAQVTVSEAELTRRLHERKGHYMPASLLASQLATLEPLAADEPGRQVSGEASVEQTIDELLAALTDDRGAPVSGS